MKQSLFQAIFALCLSLPMLAFGTQRYQVELIIFSHPLTKGVSQEQWPQEAMTLPNLENTVTLQSVDVVTKNTALTDGEHADNTDTPELLPSSQWQLASEEQHLRRHPDYHILLHEAWAQTIPTDSRTPTRIHLFGGQGYQRNGRPIPTNTEIPLSFRDVNTWQVNGVISLYLNRYINTQFNLAFAMPTTQFDALNHNPHSAEPSHQPISYLMLDQQRRTRSNELNYIDHPVYGILMKVTRLKETT